MILEQPAPLLVPLVEEDWIDHPATEPILAHLPRPDARARHGHPAARLHPLPAAHPAPARTARRPTSASSIPPPPAPSTSRSSSPGSTCSPPPTPTAHSRSTSPTSPSSSRSSPPASSPPPRAKIRRVDPRLAPRHQIPRRVTPFRRSLDSKSDCRQVANYRVSSLHNGPP